MSIKTKWIGLEAYGLKLFLIKNRFFMSGDGIDQNTNKLLALGFREVPKSAFKEGARSYWSAPSESDFLRRVVAAFPDYTVQMLPPEGINPTILVNRNQNFKGGTKNEEQQLTKRTSNAGQRVVEAPSGNTYAGADADAAVLVGTGASDDSGDQSGVDAGDGRGAELPSVADKDSRELRAGGADVSGAVESAQSADGLSEPAGASELAQPSEDGESRGLSEQPSAELGAELADERGSRLRLLSDNDARLISNAMDRRYALVERLSGDTVMLAQHVAAAIEGGDASRHAEFRKAYDSLEAQEQAFDLSALFYDTDRKDGVFAPLALMDDGNLTVGRAREVLSGAGYGWLAEHIKPVLSFSADDSKDQIAVDRVKQIIVDRFAEEAGVTGSQAEIDTDERELQSRVGRAALLASLMELSRIEAAKPQIEVEAEPELDAAGQDDKSVDAKSIRAAHQSLVVAVHGFKDTVASLKNGIASVDQSRNFTDADALVFQYEKTRTSLDSLNLASHFFDADEKIGVAAVFDNFDGLGTKIDAAKVVFDNAGYGDLFDVAWGANSLHTATETISIDRLKSWVLDVLVREQGLESVAPSSPFDDDLSDSVQEFWGMAGQIESIKTALAEMALSLEQAAADRDAAVDDAPVENNDLDIVRKSFDQLASDSATFAVEVAGLKEAAQEAISSSDYSKAEALKAAHVTLMDTVQRLELSRYFFENTDGKGVASAFSNLEEGGAYVEGGIDIDLAKLAFQDAGYGDLFESSIVAHTLFTKERTILLDDLKAVIVDGIANDADVGRAAVESVAVYDAIEQASVSLQDITHGLRQFSAAALQASEDAGEDADDVDTLNIHEAHRLRSLDIDQHLQDLAVLKGDVVRVLGSQNFAGLQEVAFEHESLARVASLATIENYFFDKSNGAGVTSVFSSFDETEIPVAHARRTFVDAGYGDLFDSSIQARELFNKSDFISIDDLKFWVTSAVEFQAGINTDLEEYQSVDETLASIKNDLDVIAGQIASMGDARSALRLAQDSRLLADNPSNFRLADFLWMAQVERLENHGRKWGVTYGLYSAFSDADDTQRAIADVHSGAVNNAIYFQLPDSNNHSGVPMPRDEVLADYPDLIEKFVDVFAVDRPEVAAAVDKGVDLVAAYHVLGSDIYVYESREKDSKVYLSGVVGDDLEVDNLTMRESLLGAIASATDAYTRLNNLGTVIGSDEGLDDAAIIDTVGDGDEPDAGAGVVDASISELDAEQQEAEQDSSAGNDNAPLDIVKRMADMGYPINPALLSPFVSISKAHRNLVRDTKVLVTPRVLYEGFDVARTDAQTQTLIMNAARPLVGSSEFQADFFDGRYYALVDTAGDNAGFQIENNVKMDAKLPVYMDMATLLALSLHSNRYANDYLELIESGERDFETIASEAIKNSEFTIDSFESAVSAFIDDSESLKAVVLGAGVDGVAVSQPDERSTGMAVGEQITHLTATGLRVGDIVLTADGGEFLVMDERFDWVEVCPIIDGVSQVSAETTFKFHVNVSNAEARPERDSRAIFYTGRNHYEEMQAQQEQGVGETEQEPDQAHTKGGAREGEGRMGIESGENADDEDDAPAAFADDEDDAEREWTGLTLEDLKSAEHNRSALSFRGAVSALVEVESSGDLLGLSARAKHVLLSFTGWGGLYESYRMDGRNSHAGQAVSVALGMDEHDFHNTVMMNRLESYYTPSDVIESMWKAVQQAGVPSSGKVLEPSVGSGHFFVGAPANVQALGTLVGIDCDPVAVRFARACAPDARIIESRFENVVLDNSFDVVIGNVPFGSTRISDSRYPKPKLIHDYFIERSLSHLKDGGLMAVITTSGTMDKADSETRANIMAMADLVAGVRLPSSVFSRDNAKVVTDILVFQKRPAGTEPSRDFTATTVVDVQGEEFRVNDFFVDNPQFILGDMVTTSSQFGPKMDVAGKLEGIGERIDAAITAQIAEPIFNKTDWKKSGASGEDAVAAWDDESYEVDSKEFTSRLIGEISIFNGKLVEVTSIRPDFDSEGVLVGETTLISDYSTSKAKEKILFDYVPLRDAAVALSLAQLAGNEEEIKLAQELALELYEGFVKSHGSANSRKVVLAIQDDPRSSEVLALEIYDQDKDVVKGLAETLYKKVVGSIDNAKIETAEDAYYVCIDRKGSIDFDYMSELSGLDPVEIRNELLGSLIFLNPKTNEIESATTYLTGNVVEKLFEAEQAALNDAQLFESNIAALQRVRPLLLPFEDISINLGANWIPPNDIRLFIAEMCNKSSVSQREVSVSYNKDVGIWKVDANTTFEKNNEIAMRSRFGTANIKFTKLLEMSLNGKKPSHFYKNGEGKMVLDHEATLESRAKQDDIQEAFVGWVGASEERKAQYAKYYNEKINVIMPPRADGSRITFAGMAAAWKPRAHQADVVAMGLMGNNIMAAHPVGSGKTFEMVALAVKLKQVGMSSKPMISVPNHMLAQMSREAKEIFPSAKILMVTNEDLSFKNRQRFFAIARNNDWDLIVCTHSMLDRLQAPFKIKFDSAQGELLLAQRQLEMTESNNQKRILTTKIQTIKSKLDKLVADNKEAQTDPDKAPMLISDIGVDTLLVDEAHLYKNLFLNTGMQVLGISQSGSQRASNLLEISQYFRELHGKCAGLHFFTGTPIANSVAELYVHNRFLRPDIFESMGINTFDQWALNFGKTVDKAEVLADGSSIGIRTRFSEFQNLPELIKLFRTFADVRTHAELNLPTPKLNSNTVIVEQTQLGKDHMVHLGIRAVATRNQGRAGKGMDNILNIATDGRKAALDLQMIDHRLPDDASNKLAEVAKNIMTEWEATHEQKGAQLVFMDLGTPGKKGSTETDKRFSGYDKLKDILVESGMPREQIAYIHDAKNDTQKDAIFRSVRSGDIRVLIGSTLKMGVGTNVQERLCALHNVDCPWRPDQLEQRIGRIMRQGNLFFDEVTEHRYVTKDSIELFMYQKLETKDKFIKQAMASPDMADRVMSEEIDAGYGDIMASATGEVRIKEKFETDAAVESLERRKRSWVREQAYVRDHVSEMRREIAKLKSNIESYKAVQQALPKSTYKAITVRGSVFAVQDGDTNWLSATSAGVAIKTRFDTVAAALSRSNERSQPLKVNIGDIELMMERNGFKENVIFADLDGRSVPKFSIKETKNPQSLGKAVRSLYDAGGVIKNDLAQIKVVEDNIARSPAVQMSWPLQADYEAAFSQKQELDAWFVKQDFDKRFEGIADPFRIKLDAAIAAYEQKIRLDDESDIELFDNANTETGNLLAEIEGDTSSDFDLDDVAVVGEDGEGHQRVASKGQSMGL